jgi:hypothetical protein
MSRSVWWLFLVVNGMCWDALVRPSTEAHVFKQLPLFQVLIRKLQIISGLYKVKNIAEAILHYSSITLNSVRREANELERTSKIY